MAQHGADAPCAPGHQAVGQVDQRAAGDGEIVHDQAVLALDLADDLQDGGVFGVIHALLVADGDGQVQHGGELAGLLGVARVGGDHDHVAHVQLLDDLGQHEGGVEVVHGALEEALKLLRVQIHGDEAVGSG